MNSVRSLPSTSIFPIATVVFILTFSLSASRFISTNEELMSFERFPSCKEISEELRITSAYDLNGNNVSLQQDSLVTQRFLVIRCAKPAKPCSYVPPNTQSWCYNRDGTAYAKARAWDAEPETPYTIQRIRLPKGCSCFLRQKQSSQHDYAFPVYAEEKRFY